MSDAVEAPAQDMEQEAADEPARGEPHDLLAVAPLRAVAPVNHKRVYRIMQANSLLLARKYTERPGHVHDGKVIVMRSNLRWC